MFIIKDHVIINSAHIIKIQPRQDRELKKDYFIIDLFLSDGTIENFNWNTAHERDLAFYSILQSIGQNLATCYLDHNVSRYMVIENLAKSEKKKPKKDAKKKKEA